MNLAKKKVLAATLACASLFAPPFTAEAAVKAEPPGSVIAENGEPAYIVTELVIKGNQNHSEEEIRRLVPEAVRPLVRTKQLSRQLSLLNDGEVMHIESALTPLQDHEYRLTLFVEEVKNDRFAISVNNTGNEFTGKWRTAVNWINTDISRTGDALGLAYTTSPDRHLSDVTQIGATYKAILPKSGDSMYFAYSYSDVDMGTIYNFPGGLHLDATGQGHTASLHYQHNIQYSKAHRQMIDAGFDYKKYKNEQSGIVQNEKNYTVGTFSVIYMEAIRRKQNAFSWNVGWTTNILGNKSDYEKVRAGTDKRFNIFRLGAGYQHQTKSDWRFGLNAYTQWTPDDIIPSEQFGAGGFGSVRGFRERVATGDRGVGGSLEIYTPQYLPHSRFVLFLDAASLGNNHMNLGERSRNLASFGLGYRFASEKLGLYASLDYAKPISYGGLQGGTRPWTFTLTKTF